MLEDSIVKVLSEKQSIREGSDKKIENDACMRPVVLSPLPRGAFPGWKVCEMARRSGRLDVSIRAPEDASDRNILMPWHC